MKNAMRVGAIGAMVSMLAVGAAQAQTVLRVGFTEAVSGIDQIFDPQDQTAFTSRAVFNHLIDFDPETGNYLPALAESWENPDDTTYIFHLRHGVTFQDGSPFNADDVVALVNFVADPSKPLRVKDRFSWMDHAEKMDDYTVKIVSREPYALAMLRLANDLPIYPDDSFSSLPDCAAASGSGSSDQKCKEDFGRQPIGTGAYRVVKVNSQDGVVLERNPDYAWGNKVAPEATFDQIVGVPIPDIQTQMAQLLSGGIDLVRNMPKDQLQQLASMPRLEVWTGNNLNFYYLGLDALGRTTAKPLQDKRVREAIAYAINRDELIESVIGNGAIKLDALCLPVMVACTHSVDLPGYDPDKAKQLLAEAGYPNGFPVTITTVTLSRQVAEAIAGYLRAVGIQASLDNVTMANYRDKQNNNQQEILVSTFSGGGIPHAASNTSMFFSEGPRNYYSEELTAENTAALEAISPEDQNKAFGAILDKNNADILLLPLASSPTSFVHDDKVTISGQTTSPYGGDYSMFMPAK